MNKTSYIRLFKVWLPFVLLISTIGSTVFIFIGGGVKYINSFPYFGESLLQQIITVPAYALEVSGGLITILLLGSLLYFLTVEVFAILRSFRLRKVEGSGIGKFLLRLLIAQPIALGISFVGSVLVIVIPLCISFTVGYIDLKISLKDSLNGVITDNEEIVKMIRSSNFKVDAYNSIGEFGVVLASRNYQKIPDLTPYQGIILPLIAKSIGESGNSESFFLPKNNNFVYTNFKKNESDKILIELAFNRLRHDSHPTIISALQNTAAPTVIYLNNQMYAPFMRKKTDEIVAKKLQELQELITKNEVIVRECKAIDISNIDLITKQKDEYQQSCVRRKNISNCDELAAVIQQNSKINSESSSICKENQIVLSSQYENLNKLKAEAEYIKTDVLLEQRNELSNGMYFPSTKTAYMRIIPGQDTFTYLSTLIHELLHHYSQNNASLPEFINEGTTEYLTLKNLELNDYELARNSAYTNESQIIMALLERIPEEDLVKVYTSDDETRFQKLFEQYFPNIEYLDFIDKGAKIFNNTYEVGDLSEELSYDSLLVNNSLVRDMRTFLGLTPSKLFY